MKVLIAHNDYGKYSGEEAVVDRMEQMLKAMGIEVAMLRMTSAGSRETLSGKVHGFFSGIYSRSGIRAMREALRREKPDVVNVHNLFPFISPAALKECRKAGVPVVMTIHNFRLMCPTGLFMRDGAPCELCLQRGNEWGCIRYNCEASRLKSVGYALRGAAARWRGDFRKCVTRFACITDFQRRKLIEAGYEPERITVIPNAMDLGSDYDYDHDYDYDYDQDHDYDYDYDYDHDSNNHPYVAFCGRLSREKGIDMIVEVARRNPGIPFRLAGEVRDRELLEPLPPNVELAGYLSGDDLENFYRGAAFFVMASRWYEGFPMAILESARYSKPTIGPNHGGFTEIIGSGDDAIGALFPPGDTDALEAEVKRLWSNPALTRDLGRKASQKLKRNYSTEVVARQWKELLLSLTSNN